MLIKSCALEQNNSWNSSTLNGIINVSILVDTKDSFSMIFNFRIFRALNFSKSWTIVE